ncbi:MAG: energy-coupling factor transporter transmembrane component T [Coriobacteriales bacterium]|nr:energy-coupling factor transporter transmembrane component T [Coriobacteriales bacterium]
MQLPSWLVGHAAYEPKHDRDSFLRKNVLSLASALLVLRTEALPADELSALDRLLSLVAAPVRLVSAVVLVACVSLAKNMAFAWIMLALGLVVLCLRPARMIRPVLAAALLAGGVAFLVNAPALLLGQTTAPVRMGTKTLVTVGMVASIAQSLGPDGLVAALRGCRLPAQVVMTVDLALRDVVLLGESARTLSEALELRSVGHDSTKTSSAAGVMGVTFLLAHNKAVARAEAMELRGYGDGMREVQRKAVQINAATMVYGICVALLVVLFAYLEVSLA